MGKSLRETKRWRERIAAFEFEVTKYLESGKTNGLAVEVFAPGKNDLGITWVDWNPTPPDKNMGIWKEVFLTSSGDVTVRNPYVASKLGNGYTSAALTASADLHNAADNPVQGNLHFEMEGVQLNQAVSLAAGETKTVRFTPEQFAELQLAHPRLWWPYAMGEPNLYKATLTFDLAGQGISDSASTTFGIREVTSELTPQGGRLFKVNGHNVLIRGAAWAPDLLFRWSSAKARCGPGVCPRHGHEHDSSGRATGSRRVLHQDRPPGDFGDAGLDVLRCVGKVVELESRAARDFRGIAQESDTRFAATSQHVCVAERQRWSAAGRC